MSIAQGLIDHSRQVVTFYAALWQISSISNSFLVQKKGDGNCDITTSSQIYILAYFIASTDPTGTFLY